MVLTKLCARLPTPWAAWIHQIHAAGGVVSSITMVVVFVVCWCCVLHLIWLLPLVVCKKVQEDMLVSTHSTLTTLVTFFLLSSPLLDYHHRGRWDCRKLTGYEPKNASRLPIKAIPPTTTSGGEAASTPLLKLGIKIFPNCLAKHLASLSSIFLCHLM